MESEPATPPDGCAPDNGIWIRLVAIAACILIAGGFWAASNTNLDSPYAQDYDEGVYLCSAQSTLRGQRLFADVFSSQPPLFVTLIAMSFEAVGPSVAAGRGLIVVFALFALLGVAWIASKSVDRLAGPFAMLCLGSSALFFREARTVQAEMPALAFSLIAIGVLVEWRMATTVRQYVFAGILFFLALSCKLLMAPYFVPAFVLMASRPFRDGSLSNALVFHEISRRALLFVLGGMIVVLLPLMSYDSQDVRSGGGFPLASQNPRRPSSSGQHPGASRRTGQFSCLVVGVGFRSCVSRIPQTVSSRVVGRLDLLVPAFSCDA